MPITIIDPRNAELGGGLIVHRSLPSRQQRMIGAWCFLDHAGPVEFADTQGMHVGAHPHIGLQTFTWMIEGQVLHRDSLGNEQMISPGEVNLMTAGRGIVHTEDSLTDGQRLHAAQLWIALPPEAQNCEPDFAHYADPPHWEQNGVNITLLAGDYQNQIAPTKLYSKLVGLDFASKQASTVRLDLEQDFEYGLLPLTGHIRVNDQLVKTDQLAYLPPGKDRLQLELSKDCRALLLGGVPFEKPILMWWNFVGFTKAEIVKAQEQWECADSRFPQVGDGQAPKLVAPPIPWSDL